MKRKHQIVFEKIITDIIAGSSVRNIVCNVTPGGGKSSLPIVAGRLITAGLADKICWICPRMSLQDQAERNFIDPFFRQMFGHRLTIRSSTNEPNPCRGTEGFVTTYQAIGVDDRQTVLNEIRSRRYILVLDEFHHAEAEDGSWTKALQPLYEAATFRILMTGTLERGDRKKIAFTPYAPVGSGEFMPCFEADDRTAVIEYTRRDALRDRGIIPLSFLFSDGTAKWQKLTGKIVEAKISTAKDPTHALYTALHTEYAEALLDAGVKHWQSHQPDPIVGDLRSGSARRAIRKANEEAYGSALLVVAASIESAKEYTAILKRQGLHAEIATSDDTPQAVKQIKALKAGKLKILVTVAMAYEGLDCPSISHIVCLTNVRSSPWISQMVARAVRIDPAGGSYESQRAYIFAPNDLMFREIAAKIEADQTDPAIEQHKGNGKQAMEADGGFELDGADMRAPGGITPLSSRLTGYNEMPLFGDMAMDPEIKTNREQETDLLSAIEAHIRRYSFQNRYNPKRLNAEIYTHFGGKARRQMTISELEEVLAYVRERYRAYHIRGTGRPRVPTKAVQVAVQWR